MKTKGINAVRTFPIFSIAIALCAAIMLCALCSICLTGCSSGTSSSKTSDAGNPQGSSDEVIKIGTMPTEDILPMWIAEDEGMFQDAGIDAEVVTFDSAQALSAAITSGEIDMAMVDIMRAVKLCEVGTPVIIEWITLGVTPDQGRFGVMASADAPYSTLEELAEYAAENPNAVANAGVGVAANTVPEYVFDMLCKDAGIEEGAIPTQEIASLPERYSLMASGKIAAAALPGSLLALGEANGMKLLADDTKGDSISQSIMIAREKFANGNDELIMKIAEIWDKAIEEVNSNPNAYIELLSSKANLNETIADSYPVCEYPFAIADGKLAHPSENIVDSQIDWMKAKGYSTRNVSYDASTGVLSVNE